MEMFHYEFMQRAFWAGGLIALFAPLLGVFLMLRRQALMADTLSHVSLAGVALGTLIHVNPVVMAFFVCVIASGIVELLRRVYAGYSEISVAIMMTGGLASAVVIMSLNKGLNAGFNAYLFGSIVAVKQTELYMITFVCIAALLYFIVFRRHLYNLTFDEETAQISGTPVKLLSMSFSILTGMAVSVSMPIVGVLLVSALMILPAALAIRLATGFVAVIVMAVAIGLTGIFSGLTVSYYVNTPPGGTIALTLLLFMIVGIVLQKVLLCLGRKKVNKGIHTEPVAVAESS